MHYRNARQEVKLFLQSGESSYYLEEESGNFACTLYADYRDKLSGKQIAEILSSDDPETAFLEKLEDAYWYSQMEIADAIEDEMYHFCNDRSLKQTCRDLTDEEKTELKDQLFDLLVFRYPTEHYMDQTVQLNIYRNYDFTLNHLAPAWGGAEKIDSKASLLWLTESQGYKKQELEEILFGNKQVNTDTFLGSVYQEVENESSSINVLTFLISTSFREAMELVQKVPKEVFYEPEKRTDTGTLHLPKKTTCGLYDPWNGGGSCFEIKLEKDLDLPCKYIASALPDGESFERYTIESVYGMCGTAWTTIA